MSLRGYIGEWDGEKVDRLLFESSTQVMNASGQLQEFAFAPHLALGRPGKYIAFLSVSRTGHAGDREAFGMPISGQRISGGFIPTNSALDSSQWFSPWTANEEPRDVWFKARLLSHGAAPTPEPTSITLLGVGVVVVAWRKVRRREGQQPDL